MIDVILPCLNEATALPWVLDRIDGELGAIVVDNGSTDASPKIAAEHGAHVVHCAIRGYGAACHAGLLAASADFVAFCDCDCSIDPAIITNLAAPVIAGSTDLVVGRRRPERFTAWPVHARLANVALAWQLRRLTGAPVYDVGPLRIARRQSLIDLDQQDRRSGYPLETVLLAAKAGWQIEQADIGYRPRDGRSKVTGTMRGSLQAVRDMSAALAR
ncbi:MAG TPA: glycosyltransferase family 2 protein [Jatrophihabitans sp.]